MPCRLLLIALLSKKQTSWVTYPARLPNDEHGLADSEPPQGAFCWAGGPYGTEQVSKMQRLLRMQQPSSDTAVKGIEEEGMILHPFAQCSFPECQLLKPVCV